jgi:hypothetical protein
VVITLFIQYKAEEKFALITGGPKPRADQPGIDVKANYSPNQFSMKQSVV